MSDEPIDTNPLSEVDELLLKKFYESVAAQSELMDKVSAQLLTIELAVPGIYATAAKLISGDKATVVMNFALYLTFCCWFLALILTLFALVPKKWKVDTNILIQDPKKYKEGLGIEDFFDQSADYKKNFIVASCLLFFAGIVSAMFTIGAP